MLLLNALMIIIASADENLEAKEISVIKDIISDFYSLEMEIIEKIMKDAQIVIDDSITIPDPEELNLISGKDFLA